ncbi:TetR family transcriptional regulator [Nocardia sp. NPDC051030]|uniref:TetR/AcrR family transcriptional regulator n=1 Tax=Nocardia sp. NPDC051030 TaxID=3155162 RepID=UPI003427D928
MNTRIPSRREGPALQKRRAARRAAILAAGLDLIGTGGTSALTIRAVCQSTRLTERHVYDNFASRDALVAAVFDDAVGRLVSEGLVLYYAGEAQHQEPMSVLGQALTTILQAFEQDPRLVRLLLIEPPAEPVLRERFDAFMNTGEQLIVTHILRRLATVEAEDRELAFIARALLGAVVFSISRWATGEADVSIDEFVELGLDLVRGIIDRRLSL